MNRTLVVALVALAVAAGLFYGRRTSDQSPAPPSPGRCRDSAASLPTVVFRQAREVAVRRPPSHSRQASRDITPRWWKKTRRAIWRMSGLASSRS